MHNYCSYHYVNNKPCICESFGNQLVLFLHGVV